MMKTTVAQTEITRVGVAEQGSFSIKASAKAFKILSDGLYTDKVMAVIRELSSNAYDAHVAAGTQGLPFEVHLPNRLEPFFYIRDYGTGLSHQDVMRLYTTYFDSTKTDSNDFTGALGLGSKSPLSYAESFTVTSYFGGEMRIYTVDIGEAGVPTISLAEGFPIPTDEANGLKIELAVKADDFQDFQRKAKQVYKRYRTQPTVVGVDSFKLDKVEYLMEGTGWRVVKASDGYHGQDTRSYAVQGTVAYPIDLDAMQGLTYEDRQFFNGLSLEMDFKIGDLDVAANREGLGYDERTSANLLARMKTVLEEIGKVVSKKFDDCTTLWDAWALSAELHGDGYSNPISRMIRNGKIKIEWKGQDIGSYNRSVDAKKDEISFASYNEGERSHNRVIRRVEEGLNNYRITFIPSDKVLFVIDDLEKGGVARFKHYVSTIETSSREPRAFMVRAESKAALARFRKEIGIGNKKLIKTSSLPKPPKVTKQKAAAGTPGYDPRGNAYQWQGRSYRKSDRWANLDVDLSVGGVYLPINRGELDYDDNRYFDMADLIDAARKMGVIDQTAPVYGIPKSLRKRVQVKHAAVWTDLYELVKKHVQANKDSVIDQVNILREVNEFEGKGYGQGRVLKNLVLVAKKLDAQIGADFHFLAGIRSQVDEKIHAFQDAARMLKVDMAGTNKGGNRIAEAVDRIRADFPMVKFVENDYNLEDSDVALVAAYVTKLS